MSSCVSTGAHASVRLCSCVRKGVHKGVTKCTSIAYRPDLKNSFLQILPMLVDLTTHKHVGRLLKCGPRFAAVPHVMLVPIIHE